MKKKNIDTDALLSFYPKLQAREVTQAAVAKHFGVTRETLRAIAKRSGYPLPAVRSSTSLATRLLERYSVEELQRKTQYEIAAEFGTCQPNVCLAFRQLNIKPGASRSRAETEANCKIVVDYIVKNGGYVVPTIKKLGISVDKLSVYRYARDNGIDLKKYRFAYRRYNNWITQPCIARRVEKSNHILLAECQLCGNTYEVRRINLVSGSSTGCRHCSSGASGGYQKVRCVQTGQIFRSIRAWACEMEGPSRYQSLRLRIKRTGRLVLKDKTYELIVSDGD